MHSFYETYVLHLLITRSSESSKHMAHGSHPFHATLWKKVISVVLIDPWLDDETHDSDGFQYSSFGQRKDGFQ